MVKKAKKKILKKIARKPVKKTANKKTKTAVRKTAQRAAKRPVPRSIVSAPIPAAAPAQPPKTGVAALPPEKQIAGGVFLGEVEDFFAHVGVVALKLLAPVSVGDMIRVKGHSTDITQKLDSMQINHSPVQAASTGDSIGIKIADKARRGDAVYKI